MSVLENIELGKRSLSGHEHVLVSTVLISWAFFQIWYASSLPFWFGFGIFNDTEARAIHLAFSLALIFFYFPFSGKANHISSIDFGLAVLGAASAIYLFVFHEELSGRPGSPITTDLIFASIGLVLLLEATRRAIGLTLVVVSIVFIGYSLAGPWMPDVIEHKGVSWSKLMSHQWLSTEGVFGVALGVSTGFVFLFVLFGAILEQAGAGQYFIRMAFVFLGHMRGGPAKAAVVASGLSGIISGSSIANVVTTGNFTIPLMKKVGFPAHKAAAVEVAASTNGQLTPPIMGAAAFLMVEYVGIPYTDVIKHAILPALVSYIALIYIVHLEACKNNLKGIPRARTTKMLTSLANTALVIVGISALSLFLYYAFSWTKEAVGGHTVWLAGGMLLTAYVALLRYGSQYHKEADIDLHDPNILLPPPGAVVKSGLYYFLPVVVLLWCMVIERFSPGTSVFYALMFLMFITLTQKALLKFFIHTPVSHVSMLKEGLMDCYRGMYNGSRNMIGIAAATAVAGTIVGTVTLTGLGQHMIALVEWLSGNNLIIMLLLTAAICLILGMGLPTTANYIVVSTLMAPVIVTIGAQQGLIVPLVAVHMFVFYFGILADDTPPVGLAAYAGSAIAQSEPIKTGLQSFAYDIRTAILPFMFIFNTELLLIGVNSPLSLFFTISGAILAMMCFASATQGYMFTTLSKFERIVLILLAFSFFRPDFWMDQLYDKYQEKSPHRLVSLIDDGTIKRQIRLQIQGENLDGNWVQKTVQLPVKEGLNGEQVLSDLGFSLATEADRTIIDNVVFGSQAQKEGLDFDFTVLKIEIPNVNRIDDQWLFIPTLFVLWCFVYFHRRRSGAI